MPSRAPSAAVLMSVRLLEQPDDRPVPVEGATWIQIATEGAYKGHPSGAFELNRDVFEQIVANFREHPSYVKDDATGFGKEGVIAFDFQHASEEPPSRVGVMGAPAQAWALELEVRDGDKGCELWALTEWLEPARTYVQQKKYKWTSIAVWPNATEPKTGKNIGYYISSIAFTNDPFIQGMVPIAAQRRGGFLVALSVEHLFAELKWQLGLPETATPVEVATELAKLRAMSAPGVVPPAGVDVEGLLRGLRSLLNLPTLADSESVFAEVDKLMGAIAAAPPGPNPTTPNDQATTTAAVAATKGNVMKEHLVKLARRLGIDFNEADLDDEINLRLLAARVADATVLKLNAAESATKGIAAIAKALGVDNPEEAVARLTEMMAAFGDIKAAMPGLAAIMEGQIEAQVEEEEEDVEQVAAERGWGDDVIALARAQRSGGVDFPKRDPNRSHSLESMARELKEHNEVLGKKLAAREAFRKRFPRDKTPDPGYLRAELATQRTSDGQPPMTAARPSAGSFMNDKPAGGLIVELDKLPGENLVQKCEAHIRKQKPGASYDEINMEAVMLARTLRPKLMASGR